MFWEIIAGIVLLAAAFVAGILFEKKNSAKVDAALGELKAASTAAKSKL